MPPSTSRSCPVMLPAASLRRKSTALAHVDIGTHPPPAPSARRNRRRASGRARPCRSAASASCRRRRGPSTPPGLTLLTRTPWGPASSGGAVGEAPQRPFRRPIRPEESAAPLNPKVPPTLNHGPRARRDHDGQENASSSGTGRRRSRRRFPPPRADCAPQTVLPPGPVPPATFASPHRCVGNLSSAVATAPADAGLLGHVAGQRRRTREDPRKACRAPAKVAPGQHHARARLVAGRGLTAAPHAVRCPGDENGHAIRA